MKNLEDYKGFWVFVETENGVAKNVGYELLGPARKLSNEANEKLTAVVIGYNVGEVAKQALRYGADEVIVIDHENYDVYDTDHMTGAITYLAEKYLPSVVFIGATNNGRDMGSRLACRLMCGLTADCTELSFDKEENKVEWTRPTFGGNLLATIHCPDARPQMGTIRPGVFKKPEETENVSNVIIEESFILPDGIAKTTLIERVKELKEMVNLEEAEIIVSGGRGVGTIENFELIREFADTIGAAVGASRAVVDMDWIHHAYQIGQTGKTVSPRVYFACGISGAIQHLAGISGADTVIAINNDPDAPIFGVADYGIVGDLKEVLPELIKAYKESN